MNIETAWDIAITTEPDASLEFWIQYTMDLAKCSHQDVMDHIKKVGKEVK